jgi:hypothetical protein
MRDLTCEYCISEITFNEYCNNNGLCDSCFRFQCEGLSRDKIVRGCDNYLECGNDANVVVGDGSLCDPCRAKIHNDIKKVFMNSPAGKKALAKFIDGLQRALSVESTT